MIIAFTGQMRSGKSTACELLKAKGYSIINFADPLKELVAELLNIPLSDCNDQDMKALKREFILSVDELCLMLSAEGYHPPQSLLKQDLYKFNSLREVLQFIGTEAFREVNSNHWVDKLVKKLYPNHNYVISDCRFENEIQAIKDAQGYTILIKRPGYENNSSHRSEGTNYSTDYTIVNTDLSQFKQDVLVTEALINGTRQAGQSKK